MSKMTIRAQLVTSISHIWLVLWLVAIPLIHIHPEADHAHGAQDHKHGGLFHSVFSKDLACEFHDHSTHNFSFVEKDPWGALNCKYSQDHLFNHDEIGFSLLSSSSSDSSPSHEDPIFLLASPKVPPHVFLAVGLTISSERAPPAQLHASLHHIRPPPPYSA